MFVQSQSKSIPAIMRVLCHQQYSSVHSYLFLLQKISDGEIFGKDSGIPVDYLETIPDYNNINQLQWLIYFLFMMVTKL